MRVSSKTFVFLKLLFPKICIFSFLAWAEDTNETYKNECLFKQKPNI